MIRESAAWDEMAASYYEESITPFRRGVRFGLRGEIDRCLRGWRERGSIERRVAIDFGCGLGDALEFFAGRIGLAAGVDFSPKMLAGAAARLDDRRTPVESCRRRDGFAPLVAEIERREAQVSKRSDRTTLLCHGDLLDLSALESRVDLAVSINAICPSTPAHGVAMLAQILSTLKDGGIAIIVVPSAEATRYLFDLAREHGDDLSDLGGFDAARGILRYADGERQKYLDRTEIETVTRKLGLELVSIDKLEYPWSHMRDAGWGYYPRCPRLWDWTVHVERCG